MRRKKILKTKPLLTFVSFIFCVAVGSLFLPGSTEGSCRINDISLEKMGNFTKVTIYADKPFEFVHSTLDKKDGKPYRVIIDCKDAIHNLPQYNFKNGLPQGTIKAIRTSQFQAEPEKIVRIVLDLEKPIIYKVTEKGEEKRGGIAILTTQEPSFPFWAAAKDEKGASKTKSVSPIRVEKINNIKSQAEENFLTSSENKSWFDFEWTENARPEEVKKRTAFERSLCFADTSETETNLKAQNSRSQVSEVLIAKPEIEKKEVATIKKASGQTGGRMVLATVGTSPVIFSVPNQNDENLQSGQVRQKRVGTDRKQETSKGDLPPASMSPKKERASATQKWDSRMVSSRHSVREEYVQKEQTSSEEEMTFSAGEVRKKVNEAVEESETAPENLTAKITEERIEKESISSPGKLVFTAGKSEQTAKEPPEKIKNSFIGPNTESRAVSHTGGVQETTKEPAEESKADLSDLTTREEEVAFLSPEEKSTEENAGSPESLVVISKPQGTTLGVVPQRKIIYYHGEGERDPFVPLTERISTEIGEIPLPAFESLKLVGILKDEAGNRALLEDERGYGYIMKNGDKIKNGYVISVEDDKVIFQIQEYGWSKTMALELSN